MDKITQQIIKVNLQAQINGVELLPICLYGARGLGKTSTIASITKEIGSKLYVVSIPAKNLEFFSGLPNFNTSTDLAKYSMSGAKSVQGTTWTASELIANANHIAEQHGSCVLLLDDLHKLNQSTSTIMYQLLLDKSLGDFKLHPKVAIIAAMNDTEDAGFSGMESPILDRLSLLKAEYNHEEWMKHFGSKLHYLVSSFLKANPQFAIEAESTTTESSASPRSWSYFSNNLELFDRDFINQNTVLLAKQFMSNEASTAFNKHTLYFNSMDFTAIVKSKQMQEISKLDFGDQLFWPYIINFIETPEDAIYLIDLMNLNKSDNQFIGLIAAELFVKYLLLQDGKEISTGLRIVIDKFIGTYDESSYNLKPKEKEELSKANLENQSELLAYASSYIQ